MSFVTIEDVRKAYEGYPVWSSLHRFYVYQSGCAEHLHLNFNCPRCRTGRWSLISNEELSRIAAKREAK